MISDLTLHLTSIIPLNWAIMWGIWSIVCLSNTEASASSNIDRDASISVIMMLFSDSSSINGSRSIVSDFDTDNVLFVVDSSLSPGVSLRPYYKNKNKIGFSVHLSIWYSHLLIMFSPLKSIKNYAYYMKFRDCKLFVFFTLQLWILKVATDKFLDIRMSEFVGIGQKLRWSTRSDLIVFIVSDSECPLLVQFLIFLHL